MEHVEYKTGTKTFITHKFYCDDCGEFVGSSTEFDDGYYEEFGNVECKFLLSSEFYRINKTLCESCKNKIFEKIAGVLLDVGFEKWW